MNTREQIIKTAFELFLQEGYKDVSLMEIVRKLKLTKGAFYHYFSSKEELFRDVVQNYMIKSAENSFNVLDQSNLKEFMSGYLDNVQQAYLTLKQQNSSSNLTINYYYLAFDALRMLDGFDKAISEMHRDERSVWAKVIQNAKDSGEIKTSISNERLAKMFIGINDGVGMQLALQSRFEDNYQEIQTLWNDIYQLIEK